MPTELVEFRLDVRGGQDRYDVTITADRVIDAATAPLGLVPSDVKWQQYRERIDRHQTSEQFFQTLGGELFEALIPQPLRISYEVNNQYIRENAEGRALAVQLRLLDDPVVDLPWECLFHPVGKFWLGANPQTPLSRYVDAPAPPPLHLHPPLKLLIATAEPRTMPPVGAQEEVQAVQQAITPLLRTRLVAARLLAHTTRSSLHKALEDFSPHLFHFVGHGQRIGRMSGLVLETPDGADEFVSADTLRELLAQCGQTRAVVLNACESSGCALALARAGLAAIGMQDKIRSEAAIPFCRSFYESISRMDPLDVAANRGRFTIRMDCGGDRRDWMLPAIYLPAGRGNLFQMQQAGRVVRITSNPPGAEIHLDRRPTGKVTPETLVCPDLLAHEVHVVCAGYAPSSVQRLGAGDASPSHLDFQLASAPGFLAVLADEAGADITAQRAGDAQTLHLGQVDRLCRLGPVRLEPGRYVITARWPNRPGATDQTEAIVRQGATAQAQVRLHKSRRDPFGTRRPGPRGGIGPWGGKHARWLLAGLGAACLAALVGVSVWGLMRTHPTPPADRTSQGRPLVNNPLTPPPPEMLPRPQPVSKPLPMEMVTLPAGEVKLGYQDDTVTVRLLAKYPDVCEGGAEQILAAVPEEVTLAPYFIDVREVTVAEYRKFLEAVKTAGGDAKWRHADQPADKTDHTPTDEAWKNPRLNKDDQPVVGVDFFDAWAYAKWAGKRLPTADEWEHAARGPGGLFYPWGNTFEEGKCNGQEAPTNSPLPSGRFPADRSPFGVMEMGGNVAEFTTGKGPVPKTRVMRGGAWNLRPTEACALAFLPRFVTETARPGCLGIRCAADAPPGAAAPPGMVRIPGGRVKLGGEAGPMLTLLRAAIKGMTAQSIQRSFLSQKPTSVAMPHLQIGRYEVTNAQYGQFLKAVAQAGDAQWRHLEQPEGKDHTPEFWTNPQFNSPDRPVVGVDYYDAYAFAKWSGGRLPTTTEWTYAARGTDARLYPWGDEYQPGLCNDSSDRDTRSATPGGTYPKDCGPTGVMDLAGNVQEWTDTPGPTPGTYYIRGADWTKSGRIFGVTYIQPIWAMKNGRSNQLGLRIVKEP